MVGFDVSKCRNCINGNHTGTNGTAGCTGCECECGHSESHGSDGPSTCPVCRGCRDVSEQLAELLFG